MKKLMILLAVLLTANVMIGQDKDYQNAVVQNRNGYYERAMQSIEKSVNHEGFTGQKPYKQAKAWFQRAVIYQNILQSDDEELKAKAPDALNIIYESLTNCMKNQEFLDENKQDIFQRVAIVIDRFSEQAYELTKNKQFAEAAPLYKKASDIAKSLGVPYEELLYNAGLSSLLAQDYPNALAYYTELKDNGVESADLYHHLVMCHNAMGNEEQAMAMVNAGLEKFPGDANLILEKVNAYLKEGKGAEAVEDLNRLRELDPENANLLFALGTVYGNSDNEGIYDPEKAVGFYEEALRVKPDYLDAANNLGGLYAKMAFPYIKQANELGISAEEQKEHDRLIEQGNALLEKGLPYLRQVYDAQPSDDVKAVLKSIYVQLKMYDEAKALN